MWPASWKRSSPARWRAIGARARSRRPTCATWRPPATRGCRPARRRHARSVGDVNAACWIAVAVFAVVVLGGGSRMVGTAEREGAMGTRAGAARNHSPGRHRQVRRGVSPRAGGAPVHPERYAARRADPGGRAHSDHRLGTIRRGGVLPSIWTSRRGWRPLGRTPIKEARVPRGTPALEGRTERLRRRRRCRAGSVLAAPFPFQAPAPRTSARQGWSGWFRPRSRFSCSSRDSITWSPSACRITGSTSARSRTATFQRFVDDGGYRRAELWREPFVKDGRPIAFDGAMALFVDTTGRPGPATWEQGAYPAGRTTTR